MISRWVMETATNQNYAKAYRSLLLGVLQDRCQRNPRYSQRAFARDLRIAPHRVSEILRGLQGISPRRAREVASLLEWDGETANYFCDLVSAVHGRSAAERTAATQRLERRSPVKTKTQQKQTALAVDTFAVVSEWQHWALLEALKLPEVPPTVLGLAARLGVAGGLVRVALDRLEALGLVAKIAGRYRVISDTIVGGEISSQAVRHYHEQHLTKAADALTLQPMAMRDFNTLVLALKREHLPTLKQRMAEFVDSINKEFGLTTDDNPDAVYAMCLHTYRLDCDPPHSGKHNKIQGKSLVSTKPQNCPEDLH